MTNPPVERFPALDALEDVLHGFVFRVPGVDVHADRESRCEGWTPFTKWRDGALDHDKLRLAEQIHGNAVAVVTV